MDLLGLRRRPRTVSSPIGPEVVVDDRQALLFCSNDYLGLANHPALLAAARAAVERHGVGSGSSRLVSGTLDPHLSVEKKLARWLDLEATLFFSTGFLANLAVITSLSGPGDVVLSDELNHASIVQGCRLSRAEVAVYPHNDLETAARLLRDHRSARRRLLVTDALFSVDGDLAPVAELSALCREHDAAIVVDEAHSIGVLGSGGRGLCARLGVVPDVLVGTCGKAFGVAGAFVGGSAPLVSWLQSRAVSFIYTTAPPPALAASVEAALELVEGADQARRRLERGSARLRQALLDAGATTVAESRDHIIPTLIPGVEQVLAVSEALLRRGVFVQALRSPTVPAGRERLRWTAMASHTDEQIDRAAVAFAEAIA